MLGLVEFCRHNMPFATAATPQCPELFWLARLQSHHPFLSPQESECSSHDSVSKRLRGAGAHFCFVVHHLCRLSKWGSSYQSDLFSDGKNKCAVHHFTLPLCCQQGIKPYHAFLC